MNYLIFLIEFYFKKNKKKWFNYCTQSYSSYIWK